MYYEYNIFGWYIGQTEQVCPNSTNIVPPSYEVDSQYRSYWNGNSWELREYVSPVSLNSLDEIRKRIWSQIKAVRDYKVQNGGYTTNSKWFHSDTFSRTQQMGLVMMGASVPPIQWKTMDGTFITMTQTLAGQIFAAAAAHDQAMFDYAEQLRTLVYSSDTPESININTGWPSTYGE